MTLLTVVTGFGGHAIGLGIAGVGSAIGTGIAGLGAMGLWKQAIKEKKKLPSLALAMVGMPLSQVIYGMIFMNSMIGANLNPDSYMNQMIWAFFVGIAIAASAIMQGKLGAAACANLAVDDKQGAGMYIAAMGIIETVALLAMVFGMGAIPSV
ncbi:V-type ATP synthase subunit K [Ancylomarina sp. 16SWW S1-10-2]|uniref:V-type ATP synthase subunit K n=1 Tax=Ancylomarina sp. 16SWW S1-10-2 TaxID=2499681 RepID=UPI0012AD8DB8|nr:V-type ATP synthase subunit K [Ancylomarina sp. 16SWW S1-10-2]MRT92966.1 V-type ATP synthase subunit K [Ancylomarina sp. 16SWW S1-10-2]